MTSPNPQTAEQTPEAFDPARFEDYITITYPNRSTSAQYLQFFQRLTPFLQDGKLTQLSINRFLASIADHYSYTNPFYKGALKAITRCYPELELEVPKIRSTPPAKRKIKFLQYDQVMSIIRDMEDHQLRVMVRLYFECGLRASELLGMQLKNIDLAKREMSGIGKRNRPFTVKFSPVARKWLDEWLGKARNPEYPFLLYGKFDTIPLRSQRSALDYRLKCETKKMGLKGIHCHQFRHSLGHFLRADKGFDMAQVKTKLRHRSIVSTEIYAVATEEEVDSKIDREVFEVIENEER